MKHGDFSDIDTKRPSGARMYDYMLGGTDNYAVDRTAIDQTENMLPGTMAMARNNRRFLERVVRYLAGECGIRQFLDNGSGLPTQENVHQIVQRIDPGSRVVYVDNDPVVVRHQKVSLLAENQNTAFILADARNVDEILGHPDTKRLLDLGQPVALMYVSFLHFISDSDDPPGIVRRMMSHLVPGSYLVISHVVSDSPEVRQLVTDYCNTVGTRFGRVRERYEVRAYFDGLELAKPGVVNVRDWRPDGAEEEESLEWAIFGGVGRKPGEGAQ